jgi:Low-density lipoprotein receptor repeat class B
MIASQYRLAILLFLGSMLLGERIAIATSSATAPQRRQLYIIDNPVISPNQMFLASRDGSNPHVLFQPGPGAADVEVFEDHIYWTENYTYSVRRAKLDGSGAETIYQTPLIGPVPVPAGLAIDSVNRRVYWSNQNVGQIRSSNLDGSDSRLFASPLVTTPYALQVDPAGGHLYWTESGGQHICRADLDGSNSTVLYQDAGRGPTLFGLALDHVERKMYWTNDQLKAVRRANFDGSNVQTIISGPTQSKYTDLEIDPISRQLIFVDSLKQWIDRSYILQSELDGTNIRTLVDLFGDISGIAVSIPEPATGTMAAWVMGLVCLTRLRHQRRVQL